MAQDISLDKFYSDFREEILFASDDDTSGWTTEDFLTSVWEPIEITIDDIGTAKILKVIDIGSAITVDTADTNRLIEE